MAKGKATKRRKPQHPPLRVVVEGVPDPEYQRLYDEAIDAFAEALADRAIAKARAEIAAELGIEPSPLPDPTDGLPSLESLLEGPPRRRR